MSDGRVVLAARVRAVPEDGRANGALLALLAKALDVRVSDCELVAGSKGRLKSVFVKGAAPTLAARLEALCGRAKD